MGCDRPVAIGILCALSLLPERADAQTPATATPSPYTTQTFSVAPAPQAFGPTMLVGGFGAFGGSAGAPVAYGGEDAIHVHIAGNGQLFQEGPNGWQIICNVPCTTTVDPRGNFKLGGFLFRDSREFHFPADPQPLELVAHARSSLDFGRSIGGWTLTSLGVAPIVVGSLFLGGALDAPATTTDKAIGGALVGVGAVCLALGVYLLVTPSRSTLRTKSGDPLATTRAAPLAWRLSPTPAGFVF